MEVTIFEDKEICQDVCFLIGIRVIRSTLVETVLIKSMIMSRLCALHLDVSVTGR